MLHIQGLTRRFGAVQAVSNVSMHIAPGELRGVIGANGAGKSTLFKLIAGYLSPDQGSVIYRGQRIERMPAHQRAGLRISIVFQSASVLKTMTVREAVMVGAHSWTKYGFLAAMFRMPSYFREERQIREEADYALERVGLEHMADAYAESLPFGHQRSLQLAQAMCSHPDLLLLDEPAAGLRASERETLVRLLSLLKAEGLTMMLIEHDVAFVSRLADVVTVLDLGRVIAEGDPDTVRSNPRVIAAYLGEEQRGA